MIKFVWGGVTVTAESILDAIDHPTKTITTNRGKYQYLLSTNSKDEAEDATFKLHNYLGFRAIKRKVSTTQWDIYVARKWV